MKGAKLYVTTLTLLALAFGFVMALFGFNESWSQNHLSPYDPFLYATLFCISMTFLITSYHHPRYDREVTKIGKYSIRLEHLLRLVCLMFGGVIVFGVNSPFWIVETLHLAFTGLAIGIGYLMIMTYPETKRGHLWAFIGLIFGGAGFLLGFLFGFYSIALAEVIATIPFVVWMFNTWVLKDE